MKTIAIVLIVVIILFYSQKLAAKGIELYRKGQDADKLEYELFKADIPNLTLDHIALVLDGKNNNPILLEVIEKVSNPTNSEYLIDQINLSLLTKSGKPIVQQKEPLSEAFAIKKKFSNNLLQLSFLLHPKGVKALIQEAGGLIQIGQNKLLHGKYGITFRMKGTISTEGFDLPLDELITI